MPGLSAPERQKTGVLRRLVVWQGRAAGRLRPVSSGPVRHDSAVAVRAGVISTCTGAQKGSCAIRPNIPSILGFSVRAGQWRKPWLVLLLTSDGERAT